MAITTKEERRARWEYIKALSVDQFCAELGIGRTLAYQMINSGMVRSTMIGNLRRIPASEVDRLLSLSTESDTPPTAA